MQGTVALSLDATEWFNPKKMNDILDDDDHLDGNNDTLYPKDESDVDDISVDDVYSDDEDDDDYAFIAG